MWKGRFSEVKKLFLQFFEAEVVPNEATFAEQVAAHRKGGNPWQVVPIMEALKAKAKALNLWNLFLPDVSGLTQREYAELAEIMGRVPSLVEVFNCDAPDTGNMEVLHMYGSNAQKDLWLTPLLNGEIRSAFCMTEPDVASSDGSNIACKAVKVLRRNELTGVDEWFWKVDGHKWWSTGAGHPLCKIFIVMVKTSNETRHQQHTMLLVPRDTPGVEVGRPLEVFGDDDAPKGHFEVHFRDVFVSVEISTISGVGKGFEIAQGRLGPGRVHHCMRAIGMAERAMSLLVHRALRRKTFGKRLAQHGMVQEQIALSRIEIDQARLLVLSCADALDHCHGRDTTKSLDLQQRIAMIKVVVPRMACAVIDRAIQVHGGKGLSQDTILSRLYAGQRSLRIADGPDEVHIMSVARYEVKRHLQQHSSKL